jgi:hypothetical protein
VKRRARRHGRFGRHLPTCPAAPFLENMPPLYRKLAEGFDLAEKTRPYLTRDGRISVRLVLRGRDKVQAPEVMVLHWTLCGPLAEELIRVLSAAVAPMKLICGLTDDARA